MKKIVEKYNIGIVTDSDDPEILARVIKDMMCDDEKRMIWKKNLRIAADELCWENEKDKLINIYTQAGLIINPASV